MKPNLASSGPQQIWDIDVMEQVADPVVRKMVGPGVFLYSAPAAHGQRWGSVRRDNTALAPGVSLSTY